MPSEAQVDEDLLCPVCGEESVVEGPPGRGEEEEEELEPQKLTPKRTANPRRRNPRIYR